MVSSITTIRTSESTNRTIPPIADYSSDDRLRELEARIAETRKRLTEPPPAKKGSWQSPPASFPPPWKDRFHEVADQYDWRTRLAVRRAVFKGRPPLDPERRPLAVAYTERARRSFDAETRRLRTFRLVAGPGVWGSLALLQLLGGHWFIAALNALFAIFYASGALAYPQKRARKAIEKSAAILADTDE